MFEAQTYTHLHTQKNMEQVQVHVRVLLQSQYISLLLGFQNLVSNSLEDNCTLQIIATVT